MKNLNNKNIEDAFHYVKNIFEKRFDKNLTYHNWQHTEYVYKELKKTCDKLFISCTKREEILIAAVFHDIGYLYGYDNHEDRSIDAMQKYFIKIGKTDEICVQNISKMIELTKFDKIPDKNNFTYMKLLKDIDLSYGIVDYKERSEALRTEWKNTQNREYTDSQWRELQCKFILNLKFHTKYGNDCFSKLKFDTYKNL